jgi:hypothetical protein
MNEQLTNYHKLCAISNGDNTYKLEQYTTLLRNNFTQSKKQFIDINAKPKQGGNISTIKNKIYII